MAETKRKHGRQSWRRGQPNSDSSGQRFRDASGIKADTMGNTSSGRGESIFSSKREPHSKLLGEVNCLGNNTRRTSGGQAADKWRTSGGQGLEARPKPTTQGGDKQT